MRARRLEAYASSSSRPACARTAETGRLACACGARFSGAFLPALCSFLTRGETRSDAVRQEPVDDSELVFRKKVSCGIRKL